MKTLTYTVPAAYNGDTLQNFLRRECGLSWRTMVRLKRVEQGMTADGQPIRTIDRVKAGQKVCLRLPEDTVRIEGIPGDLAVVYEDGHLLVVDKPPYLAVHPSAGKPDPTLANRVVAYFEERGEHLSFRPCGRLDRNTSGLLAVAKNAPAAFALTGRIQKEYLAIVEGDLTGHGTVDQPLRVKEGCTITREVGEGGKPSITHWKALAGDGTLTLVRLRLETGRTHQIRAHMAWLGHPLAGDDMYGGSTAEFPRHALHCARLSCQHPVTGEPLSLESPLPEDMAALLAAHGIRP